MGNLVLVSMTHKLFYGFSMKAEAVRSSVISEIEKLGGMQEFYTGILPVFYPYWYILLFRR